MSSRQFSLMSPFNLNKNNYEAAPTYTSEEPIGKPTPRPRAHPRLSYKNLSLGRFNRRPKE